MTEKRLTAKQVVERLLSISGEWSGVNGPLARGYRASSAVVERNLIPRWQDEPGGDGWYWLEGQSLPMWVWYLGEGDWIASPNTDACDDGSPLNNRRVCPIGERPEETA